MLPTHKSHVDYMIVTYMCIARDLPIPYVIAGDNLNIPIVCGYLLCEVSRSSVLSFLPFNFDLDIYVLALTNNTILTDWTCIALGWSDLHSSIIWRRLSLQSSFRRIYSANFEKRAVG